MEEEVITSMQQQCRLCLSLVAEHYTDRLLEIHVQAENDDYLSSTLTDKIRDCLGLYIAPDDGIRKICLNCEQTVRLIDEFRTHCRQTDEVYQSVQIRLEDDGKWEQYNNYIRELRMLVQEQRNTLDQYLAGANLQEPEEMDDDLTDFFRPIIIKEECEGENTSAEWVNLSDPTDILAAELNEFDAFDSNWQCDSEPSSSQAAPVFDNRFNLKLQLANELLERLSLCTPHELREHWNAIGHKLGLCVSETNETWDEMKAYYRERKKNADEGLETAIICCRSCPLFAILNKLVPALDGDEVWVDISVDEFNDGLRIQLIDLKLSIAEEIRNNPELWDTSLASSSLTREIIWNSIAAKFNMDVPTLRFHWSRIQQLDSGYRGVVSQRRGYLQTGSACHRKLIAILQEIQATDGGGGGAKEEGREKKIDSDNMFDINTRIALAKEVYKHEIIWCTRHTDFHCAYKRDKVWDIIAPKFDVDRNFLKREWKRLRDLFRGRYFRIKKGHIRTGVPDPLYKELEKMLSSNMRVGSRVVQGIGEKSILPEIYDEEQTELGGDGDNKEEKSKDEVGEEEEEGGEENVDYDIFSVPRRIALAKEIYRHEIIWTSTHPDFHCPQRRDKVWDAIALKFDVERNYVKREWKRLRDLFRSRYLRKMSGRFQSDVTDPLYMELEKMLGSNMGVGSRGCTIITAKFRTKAMDDEDHREIGGKADSIKEERKGEAEQEDREFEGRESEEGVGENSESYNPFDVERRLALAKEVYGHDIIWRYNHPDFHCAYKRDKVWHEISAKLNVDRNLLKQEWKRLRDLFRGRYLRKMKGNLPKGHPRLTDPLYKELEKMFGSNIRVGSRGGHIAEKLSLAVEATDMDDSTDLRFEKLHKLKLAEICYRHEIIWNHMHPDYNAFNKRDEVWDLIAADMKLTRSKVKHEWRRLRDVYRGRCLRTLKGTNKIDEDDPLHRLLEKMLSETTQVGVRGGAQEILQNDYVAPAPKPFSTNDERMRLVEEVAKHELLWNFDHPDYNKVYKRQNTWKEIASSGTCFDYAPQILRTAWRRCRELHRTRLAKDADDTLDMSLVANDPFHQLMDKLMANELAHEASAKDVDLATRGLKMKGKVSVVRKRRYHGKQTYNEEGCIRVERHGILRYEKICELCGKQVERSLFEYHMNMHYGLKPYACSYEGCGKEYGIKTNRDKHEMMVHSEDGFKFACDQCGEKFKQRSFLEYHYAIKHKSDEVPCNICGKLLKHRNLLRSHLKLHGANYSCNVCGKVLQKKYSLDVHMRTHTMEKPYPCELCGERFMLKVQMKTHISKIHSMQWEEFQAAYPSVT